jgi:putative Mg2+ transporter-C (MgtC) family protein
MSLISIDFAQITENLSRIIITFALALPIGWERGRGASSVGLRTFPIVAMASCGYMLIAKSLPGTTPETQSHIIQGLLAGIGFIGGGAILKNGNSVRGVVTAASIWNTGAIGIAVAAESEEIAVVLTLMNFLALFLLTPVVKRMKEECVEKSNESQTMDKV